MSDEQQSPRKATDILVSLETKIDQLLALYRNHDLVLKNLTNKIGSLAMSIAALTAKVPDDMNETFPQEVNLKLPVETTPIGIRRTARPDSYDEKYIKPSVPQQQELAKTPTKSTEKKIPVSQRLVDKNSKAMFLADIEITNAATDELEYKTRTNSVGKWQASLTPGNYRVRILKNESLTKERFDIAQTITVDGSKPTLDLPILIVK